MTVYKMNPLFDRRWAEFLKRNQKATIFHSPGWLKALYKTYGYEPVVYTTSGPLQELENGIVFCCIKSALTGKRLVSLPFSDHCQPLVDDMNSCLEILWQLEREMKKEKWKYIEIRPLNIDNKVITGRTGFEKSKKFYFHKSDLRSDINKVYQQFDRKAVRYMVNRAERENLAYREDKSEFSLAQFYDLLILNRRKHQIPPQPLIWFKNLIKFNSNNILISSVSKGNIPIASLISIEYKDKYFYKYIGSNHKYSNLGGNQLLYWNGIKKAKVKGLSEIDWGRTDIKNEGLNRFKNRWNTVQSNIIYLTKSEKNKINDYDRKLGVRIAKKILSHSPSLLLKAIGNLIYRHIG